MKMRHRNIVREAEFTKLVRRYPKSYLQTYAEQRVTGLRKAVRELHTYSFSEAFKAELHERLMGRVDEIEDLVEFIDFLRRHKCLPKKRRAK